MDLGSVSSPTFKKSHAARPRSPTFQSGSQEWGGRLEVTDLNPPDASALKGTQNKYFRTSNPPKLARHPAQRGYLAIRVRIALRISA